MPVMLSTGDLAWILPAIAAGIGFVFAAGKWHSSVNSDRDNFKEFMQEVRQDIKEILRRMPPVPVISDSPLRLTEFGEKLAGCLNATQWAEQVAPSVTVPDGAEPFRIDEIAERFVHAHLDEETRDTVARCAYEYGIDQEGVRGVLRVILRDELLKIAEPILKD